MSISPSSTNIDDTTTFHISFISSQNISNATIQFNVDSENKGSEKIFNIMSYQNRSLTFDYLFNGQSYEGEHYIVSKMDFVLNNGKISSETFYNTVYVTRRGIQYLLIGAIFILFIAFLIIQTYVIHRKESIIEFDKGELKVIFSLIITVLPISMSFFVLSIQNPAIKRIILPTLFAFAISFFLAIYGLAVIKNNFVRINNFVFYSLCFMFLGIIYMIVSVLFL